MALHAGLLVGSGLEIVGVLNFDSLRNHRNRNLFDLLALRVGDLVLPLHVGARRVFDDDLIDVLGLVLLFFLFLRAHVGSDPILSNDVFRDLVLRRRFSFALSLLLALLFVRLFVLFPTCFARWLRRTLLCGCRLLARGRLGGGLVSCRRFRRRLFNWWRVGWTLVGCLRSGSPGSEYTHHH